MTLAAYCTNLQVLDSKQLSDYGAGCVSASADWCCVHANIQSDHIVIPYVVLLYISGDLSHVHSAECHTQPCAQWHPTL